MLGHTTLADVSCLKDTLFLHINVSKLKSHLGASHCLFLIQHPSKNLPKAPHQHHHFCHFFVIKHPIFFYHKHSPEVQVNSWAPLYLALVCFGFLPLYYFLGLKRFSFLISPQPHPAPDLLLQAALAHSSNTHLGSQNFSARRMKGKKKWRETDIPTSFGSSSINPALEQKLCQRPLPQIRGHLFDDVKYTKVKLVCRDLFYLRETFNFTENIFKIMASEKISKNLDKG